MDTVKPCAAVIANSRSSSMSHKGKIKEMPRKSIYERASRCGEEFSTQEK